MKSKILIALIIIVAAFGICVAQDEEQGSSCDPITQPCEYTPPCEWTWVVVDGTTYEICVEPPLFFDWR